MPKFRITQVYIVEAATKSEALTLVQQSAAQAEQLEWQSIRELPQQPASGWKAWTAALGQQVTGSSKR